MIEQRTIVNAGVTFNHTFIRLLPDNRNDFTNNGLFVDNGLHSTVSGMPEDGSSGGSGSGGSGDGSFLNSVPNADIGYIPTDSAVIPTPAGMTDTQFIQTILNAQSNFTNGVIPYSPLPSGDHYNSNSFIAGLLNSINLDGTGIVSGLSGVQPGSGHPVPNAVFE